MAGGHTVIPFPRPLVDADDFYRAIRSLHVRPNGRLSPGAFSKTTGTNRMSVDWAELSTPEETIARFSTEQDWAGVAAIDAQTCWSFDQTLEYSPLPGNPSHSEVVGSGSDSVRKGLARKARMVYKSPP